MKFGKILAIVAVAATCAMADVYGGFTAGLGAQAWTASYSGGSSTLADQDGPAIHFGFDVGFPLKKDDAGKVAIGFGGNFWAQQLDAYGLDDTGLLMMWGPSINAKVGKLVAGVRIGTSFVIETEYGNGGAMGFGLNSYVGYEFIPDWSVVLDAHYTTTEHNDDVDWDVSGIGLGISYNAF
ncbi:MAG: hypothetical protein J6Y56_04140 [Fibrobacterales bacterium]|nr:hypothetical protein [Fibrobacterales bacterium]